MAYSTLENGLKYNMMIRLFRCFGSRMNKLVYIYVPNEFVIGYLLLTLLIKRLAVATVNKTVVASLVIGDTVALTSFEEKYTLMSVLTNIVCLSNCNWNFFLA
jgi:hypothetical protein